MSTADYYSTVPKKLKRVRRISDQESSEDVSASPTLQSYPRKRPSETSLDGQNAKKQKMDSCLKLQCCSILEEMMACDFAWFFSMPVDPVKWNVPDYFSVITNPMDLGTIKGKLQQDLYSNAEEFASDVRLTFQNAMAYNESEHEVHKWAKKLKFHFNMKWRSLKQAHVTSKNNDVHHKTEVADECMTKNDKCRKQCLEEMVQKGCCDQNAFGASNHSQGIKCASCSNHTCCCSLANVSARVTSTVISKEKSSTWCDHSGDSIQDCDVKYALKSRASCPGLDSDGSGVVLDDKNQANISTVASGEDHVQMSPSKALRAAALKRRFADTIIKATYQANLDDDVNAPSIKKMQNDLMLQRQKERAAARMALEELEKSVVINDNFAVMRDFEALIGYRSPSQDGCTGNSIGRTGLTTKKDYVDAAATTDAEEGEIL